MIIEKKQKWMVAILLVAILGTIVLIAHAEDWQQKYVRFSAIAGETLVTGDVVCIAAADGYAYKADANDSSLRPAVGIIAKGGTTGHTVEIVTIGVLTGQTAASPGVRVFLSTTAGALMATAPTNAQPMGWVLPGAAAAATSTTYYISVVTPSTAGAGY